MCINSASEFKYYIFGMLFLKQLSDAFDEAKEGVFKYYLDQGKTQQQAEKFVLDIWVLTQSRIFQ